MRSTTATLLVYSFCGLAAAASGPISIDTGDHTVTKVRTALSGGRSCISAVGYSATLLDIGYDGDIRWRNELSGFMNHDVCCRGITGDGDDEILAAE